MSERPLVTVGGLIVAPDGEILLVQSAKWKELFSVPGGKVEWGETREEAYIREVWEETGLKITHLRFAVVQDCIFSDEFWQKRHFVMNDFIADLDSSSSKDQVKLNDEAHTFKWILPQHALSLPLHRECRVLIEWYLNHLSIPSKKSFGIVGIHQHRIPCIVGFYPEERQQEQILIVDVKIKIDLSRCFVSGQMEDSVNYCSIAQLCTALAQQRKYLLIETFASNILDECLSRFQAVWAWVCVQKPAAISSADYVFVELERYREIFT